MAYDDDLRNINEEDFRRNRDIDLTKDDIVRTVKTDYDPIPHDLGSDADDDGALGDFLTDPGAIKAAVVVEKHWYVVHCYSGQEKKVCQSIEQRIATMGMRDRIFDVLVPTVEEIEVKDGKRRTVERRVFPGYILVEMKMDEDSWYVVRNTPGVTGFVGMGNDPSPLEPDEVTKILERMAADAPVIKHDFKIGQKVRITSGPFNDFPGTIAAIDVDKSKVRVMVNFFGRDTPVELDFVEVERT
ncbi:MAG: transcription termination/antitermination protein NusG [Chloroflexota bacterium]|nr:transcription termination/antitermination protein NusG [Chloroflexota bacterium]